MTDRLSIDEMKELGAGRPAPEDVVSLYHKAFAEYGAQSLWNRTPSKKPTILQALVVAECLRSEGNMKSRPLAAQIEEVCRAAL